MEIHTTYYILFALFLIFNIQFIGSDEYFNNFITEYLDKRLQLHKYARLRTPELITLRGYPVEIHHVITNDGYILEVHRIPYGIKGIGAFRNITKPAVLLEHGGAQSSADWVLNSKTENCLGFVLADAGYDVFLGNFRGNTYSNKHVNMSLRSKEFWDFTPEEIGIYDLTAMIDHILDKTNQTKLHFIGFSMSTTAFYILLSERPEYNKKIRLGTTFGVAAYQYHSMALIMGCTLLVPVLETIRRIYGPFPIPNHFLSQAIHTFIPHFCNRKTIILIPDICYFIWTLGSGFDDFEIPKEDISLLLSKLPTSTSSKSFTHICNNVNNKRFGKFNYGMTRNMEKYGNSIPPAYNLSKITAPISLYSASNDLFCVVEDIKLLNKELPNVVNFYHVAKTRFNHADYSYGKNVGELVYKHIVKIMSKY